jgi:hypothetical protein
MTVEQQLDVIDTKRKRWQSRLTRAVNAIGKLDRQRQRVVKNASNIAMVASRRPREQANTVESKRLQPPANNLTESQVPTLSAMLPLNKKAQRQVTTDDLGIPTFLQRKKLDPVAEQILQEQQDIKRRKSAGRIAKMKAKAKGDLKKMPLTGKAALDAIREAQKKTPA